MLTPAAASDSRALDLMTFLLRLWVSWLTFRRFARRPAFLMTDPSWPEWQPWSAPSYRDRTPPAIPTNSEHKPRNQPARRPLPVPTARPSHFAPEPHVGTSGDVFQHEPDNRD